MGRYSEALGYWTLKIPGLSTEWELKPKMGDKRKFMKLMRQFQDEKGAMDPKKAMDFLEAFEGIVYDTIVRDCPPVDGVEVEELKTIIELNNNLFLDEFMLLYRLTTRDALDKAREEAKVPLEEKE